VGSGLANQKLSGVQYPSKMNVHAWSLILVLTLAGYTGGLTLYWAAQGHWRTKKAQFWLTTAAALVLHLALLVLTRGEAVLNLLVLLPGLAVLVAAWVKRPR